MASSTMADDDSFELEDGELLVASAVHGPPSPSSAADAQQFRAQLDEAATDLRHQGQQNLARLVVALVEVADLRDAMWVLNNGVRGGGGGVDFSGDPALFGAFRQTMRRNLLNLLAEAAEAGYDDDEHELEVSESLFPPMVLRAAQHAARLVVIYDLDSETTGNGGFGAVPASAAAVRCLLEKQMFCAAADDDGITECSICFEEFEDGGQVTVMPCPSSRVHRFHPDCIAKWLALSNMCPLCRHELPAAYYE